MEKILRDQKGTEAVTDAPAVLEHLFQVEYPGMVRLAFTQNVLATIRFGPAS